MSAQPDGAPVEVRLAKGLGAIAAAQWDACANPGTAHPGLDETFNPFVSHAFLSALEESGCVGGRSGWSPAHLVVPGSEGRIDAAAPCYLKSHSMGEYVFDSGWADAYERAGGRYYPKLQVAVPFTPVSGPRLMARLDAPETARAALIGGLKALQQQVGASSTHVTFLGEPDCDALAAHGYLVRTDKQFHWMDEGFGDFEGFLGALASRKRKAIRRERRDALSAGITIEQVTGRDLTEAHWDAFFAFYMDTGSRKWGRPYLNRRFFSLIGERMAERVMLVIASRAGRPIAGAINFIGDRALYGRNWGCIEDHPFLHFEVCYYQAIDFALARGLARVEAGAQGEHKLARGYRPVTTYSAHDIADPAFRRAIADYLARERGYVAAAQAEYEQAAPYRRDLDLPRAGRMRAGKMQVGRTIDATPLPAEDGPDATRTGRSMSAYDPNNVFAKILRGELPSQTVYEDERTIVIMDIMPRSDGHALVIPKAQSRTFLDMQADDIAAVYRTVQRVAKAAKEAFGADGITIQQFNESAGGQVVFHTHVHVLPRKTGVSLRPHTGEMAPKEALEAHAGKLRAALANVS